MVPLPSTRVGFNAIFLLTPTYTSANGTPGLINLDCLDFDVTGHLCGLKPDILRAIFNNAVFKGMYTIY